MSVKVAMRADDISRRAMTFTIEGLLWAQPVPQSLYLKTELDLETGAVRVAETRSDDAGRYRLFVPAALAR